MGLLQSAYETYERNTIRVGEYEEGKEPLAPVSHMITSAQLEVTVNKQGEFVKATTVDKKEPKIIIPVTEESAGRTSSPAAHPLCDQIQYISPTFPEKHSLYVKQLTAWAESEYSHPMLEPILKYVLKGTIIEDLIREKCISPKEANESKINKLLVRWRVVGIGDDDGPCWTNRALMAAYESYALAVRNADENELCMVTGKYQGTANQHPKGVVSLFGNAKLISANDKSGFTYRGRFSEEWQAETVSYEASQKAHAAIKWLVANQGIYYGGRCFLCWNPEGVRLPNATRRLRKRNKEAEKVIIKPSDYKKELREAIKGWQEELPSQDMEAIIASFDAATTGRLSLTYFRELNASDFLERLHDWDLHCAWYNGKFGIQSPSLSEIVVCAYGTERTEKNQERISVDDRLLKQQIQSLLTCRVDRRQMPLDIRDYLFERASEPLRYHNRSNYLKVLYVACAVIRKARYDYYREDVAMALEPDKKDRSYQFGRLLAVMEKVERDTYGTDEEREPNAVRLQSVFKQRPLTVADQLQEMLDRAYFPRLKPGSRAYYRKLIGEIMAVISEIGAENINKPLNEMYLVGYYLQRNAFFTKKED